MAEPTSISQVLPAPVLEGSLTAFLKSLDPLMGQQINSCIRTNNRSRITITTRC